MVTSLRGERSGEEIGREFGMDMYTFKWIFKMDNLQGPIVWHMKFYSVFVATWMGGEFGYMFM